MGEARLGSLQASRAPCVVASRIRRSLLPSAPQQSGSDSSGALLPPRLSLTKKSTLDRFDSPPSGDAHLCVSKFLCQIGR